MKDNSNIHPPRLALRFFRWFCSDARREELEGDLEEMYIHRIESGQDKFKTDVIFWLTVFRTISVYAIEPKDRINSRSNVWYGLLLQNLISIFRHFKNQRLYASLNLLGLVVTFSTVFFILSYVHFEQSFESFHTHADRIYRVSYTLESSGDFESKWARVDQDYINELPEVISGIEKLVRFQNHEEKYVKVGTTAYSEEHIFTTDPAIFEVFDFTFIHGDPLSALTKPQSIVITESLALKYFGTKNALGKTVTITTERSGAPVTHWVRGVVTDLPQNTHLPIDMLVSFKNEQERSWWAYVYVLLHENANIATIQSQVDDFVKTQEQDDMVTRSFHLQPMKEIHLQSNLAREIIPNGSMENVLIFMMIGLFVLVIGIINFSNLFTAMVLARTREVGLRKILGAERSQILWSNVQEAISYSFAASFFAGIIVFCLSDFYVQLSGATLLLTSQSILVVAILGPIIIGFFAGIYPAIIISRFKVLHLLGNKGLYSFQAKERFFSVKNVMLTFQFSIAILLMIASFIAIDQYNYIHRKTVDSNLGKVLAIPKVPDEVAYKFDAFSDRLLTVAGVASLATCMEVPSREIRDSGPFRVVDMHENNDDAPIFDVQIIDENFMHLMNVKLVAGTDFSTMPRTREIPEFTADFSFVDYLESSHRTYLINETAMRQLGWTTPEEAIGKTGSWTTGGINLAEGMIIGVVKDYHQETLKNKIDPTVYIYEPLWLKTFLIKVSGANMHQTLSKLENTWAELFPNYPLNYRFLDDMYHQLYEKEAKQLFLLKLISSLAIFITLLGIIGLVAYSLRVRVKEFAVRKVLGASLVQVIENIARPYFFIMIIALFIATPICYWGMSSWLDNFAYHTSISPVAYLSSFLIVAVLMVVTIGLQAIKTTRVNPAEILKNE